MFKVPTVKNAIFGLPLLTGTKIIGFLHAVLYTICFIVVLVKERTPDGHTSEHDEHNITFTNHTSAQNKTDDYDSMEQEILHKSFFGNENSAITKINNTTEQL